MTYKKLPTKRLFYGRWPYKVETNVIGAYYLRNFPNLPVEKIQILCKDRSFSADNLSKLKLLLDHVAITDNIQARVEGNHANFFTNSLEEVEKICNLLKSTVRRVYMPTSDDELTLLNSSKRILIVDHYPYKKYTHKIYLKGNTPHEARQRIGNWVATFTTDEVKLSNQHWFNTYGWRVAYVYFKNEKTASMLSLMAGNYISKVEKYVLRSSINTES